MEIRVEKKIIEVEETVYIAEDGTEFKSETECNNYETKIKEIAIKEKASTLEIKDLFGVKPLLNTNLSEGHNFNWYKLETEEDAAVVSMLYFCNETSIKSDAYPVIVCIESDDYYNLDTFVYYLPVIKQHTEDFWQKLNISVDFSNK